MTRRSTDHETIEAEIDRIRSLGLDELRREGRGISPSGTDDGQHTREVNAGGLLVPAILFAPGGFSPGCE
jgi:hypothetical protein